MPAGRGGPNVPDLGLDNRETDLIRAPEKAVDLAAQSLNEKQANSSARADMAARGSTRPTILYILSTNYAARISFRCCWAVIPRPPMWEKSII
jgi:hypothetical protein